MELILIAAIAQNNVIGLNGELPSWKIPEDIKRFKELTVRHPVIMGRTTYESIPEKYRPLADRRNIVLSRRDEYRPNGVEVVGSLEDAVNLVKCNPKLEFDESSIYVIGGAQVYACAMPIATKLEITQIHKSYIGDVYFPVIDKSIWKEVQRVDREEGFEKNSFVTYERKEV